MSAAGPPQGANCSTSGGSAAAELSNEAASVGAHDGAPMQNWILTRGADGLARLTFDKAGATTNTLSAAVLAELNEALDQLDADPPKGLVIASGKANGFIAGADIDEFGMVKNEADAVALVKRGWDTFNRLAAVKYPTLALVRGFCLGGGFELALACRYRVVVDEPGTRLGLPEVMLGIVPGMGRHDAPAEARRRTGGARSHAHRTRRSTRAGRRSWGSPTNACRRGSWRTPCAECFPRCRRRARCRSRSRSR